MSSLLTATVGEKGQMTLPKEVRKLLDIKDPGTLIGFLTDPETKMVRLTKLNITPEEEFSEEEYQKLLGLPKKKGGKSFASMETLLKDLKSS